MKFMVTRTSEFSHDIAPCPGATYEKYLDVDRRTFRSPEEHDAKFPKSVWASKGINHRVVRGGIERDIEQMGWFMTINSLDDLMAFCAEHGDIILREAETNPTIQRIEIYDDYRE